MQVHHSEHVGHYILPKQMTAMMAIGTTMLASLSDCNVTARLHRVAHWSYIVMGDNGIYVLDAFVCAYLGRNLVGVWQRTCWHSW